MGVALAAGHKQAVLGILHSVNKCHTPAVHSALLLGGGARRITAIAFGVEKLEW